MLNDLIKIISYICCERMNTYLYSYVGGPMQSSGDRQELIDGTQLNAMNGIL